MVAILPNLALPLDIMCTMSRSDSCKGTSLGVDIDFVVEAKAPFMLIYTLPTPKSRPSGDGCGA
eukprot:14466980-Heterocapsa_arctica.AAC.1